MTAAQLRSLTVGRVLACSPMVLVDERGRRFELVSHAVTCDGAGSEIQRRRQQQYQRPVCRDPRRMG